MEFLIEERKNKLISNLPEFYFSDIAFNYKNENYYNDKDLIVAEEDTLHISIKNIGRRATRVRFHINDKNNKNDKDNCDYKIIDFPENKEEKIILPILKKNSDFKTNLLQESKNKKFQVFIFIEIRDFTNIGRNVTYGISIKDNLDNFGRHQVEIRTIKPFFDPKEFK